MIAEVSKRNRVSLEQLRQMDGEPIWVEVIVESCIEDGYALVSVYDEYCMNEKGEFFKFEDYGKTWLAYPYPPAHIDRSKREACDHCKKACWNCNHNLFAVKEMTKCDDCVNQSKWEFLAYQNYCPKCGRPVAPDSHQGRMNMTREEAIEILENGGWWDLFIPITTIEGRSDEDKLHQAIDMAITALRSVSREQELEAENKELKERIVNWRKYISPTREQVEKAWKGEWLYLSDFDGCTWFECSKCEHALDSKDDLQQFCPNCGALMMDEAVKITMKRLEALYGKAD